jgi:integrase
MSMRRAKGDGSAYRRKDCRCIGEYVDAYGKRRYVSGKTKPEVRARLRKAVSDRDAGIAFDTQNLTVERYMERCLDSIRTKVRESTYERYEVLTRLHIVPILGSVRLAKFNARMRWRISSTAARACPWCTCEESMTAFLLNE